MFAALKKPFITATVPKEPRPMKAVWKGTVIAESDQTVVVEGNHYFPPNAVQQSLVRSSEYSTNCGWKGRASYYDVVVDGQTNKDAAFYYPEPKDAAKQIKGYLAFWKGVQVSP